MLVCTVKVPHGSCDWGYYQCRVWEFRLICYDPLRGERGIVADVFKSHGDTEPSYFLQGCRTASELFM